MPVNTVEENRRRNHLLEPGPVWLFGYGSLIHNADFPYLDRRPAAIRDWERRFWQGSHDHRGTATAPGRVVTLVGRRGAVCHGVAYRIAPEIFDHLDHREKNGYLRFGERLIFADRSGVDGVVYIATEENQAFLGPASDRDIARQIARSAGPSGRNADYLTELANALRTLLVEDPHVFAVEKQLRAYLHNSDSGVEPEKIVADMESGGL